MKNTPATLYEKMFDGGRIILLQRTDSTQDVAKEMAVRGEPEWTAVVAIEQTHGRGRSGHSWVSPTGKNLALSVILRPSLPAANTPMLSLLAAVAVANVLDAKGLRDVKLKWPNDVLVGDRKIAGILLEATVEKNEVREVIVGLGVNLNSEEKDFPQDFPIHPTSYLLCTGNTWEVEDAAQEVLREMKGLYHTMNVEGFDVVPRWWLKRWAHRNQTMVYEGKVGRALAVSREGFLILRMVDGSLLTVSSGDVLPVENVPHRTQTPKASRGNEETEQWA